MLKHYLLTELGNEEMNDCISCLYGVQPPQAYPKMLSHGIVRGYPANETSSLPFQSNSNHLCIYVKQFHEDMSDVEKSKHDKILK